MCLKISRGGISAVLEDARAARAAGAEVYLASTFDGPLGIAAGVHTAAALRISARLRARDAVAEAGLAAARRIDRRAFRSGAGMT